MIDSDDVASELVYAATACLDEGTMVVNGECVPCSPDAVCPGGGRVWPKDGYWNDNETDPRVYEYVVCVCLGGGGIKRDARAARDALTVRLCRGLRLLVVIGYDRLGYQAVFPIVGRCW